MRALLPLLLAAVLAGVLADPVVFTTPLFTHGEGGYPCIRIPAIIMTGSGKLLAFAECRTFTGDGCNPKRSSAPSLRQSDEKHTLHGHICLKSSVDNGRTWSNMSFPAGEKNWMDDPEPVWDTVKRQVILHMHMDEKLTQLVSLDEGVTWSAPRDISSAVGKYSSVFPGPAAAIQKEFEPNKGRMLWIGHYGAYDKDIVWYTDDFGETYKMADYLFPGMDEAQLVELNNGTVMANLRTNHKYGKFRAVSVSQDGGANWAPTWGDPRLIEPVCQGSIIRDKQSNAIFFSNPSSTSQRKNMTVFRSTDDTVTWSKTFSLAPTQEAAYSCLTNVKEKDHIGLMWESQSEKCSGHACVILFSLIKSDLM